MGELGEISIEFRGEDRGDGKTGEGVGELGADGYNLAGALCRLHRN